MDMKTSPLALLKDPTLFKTDALVNGEWLKGPGRFDVHDPATGQKLADVANLGPAETEAALAAAEKAWPAWRARPAKERAAILMKWFALLHQHADDLARIMSALIAEGLELADAYEGSTSELLALLMHTWWERVGDTPAAGIHKIVISEVRNFPELAQFYADEVIVPADRLFSTTIRRGIERGEFREMPEHEVAHALMAPMIFLSLHKHSFGACPASSLPLDPGQLIRTHLELVLRGLEVREAPAAPRRRRPCSRF